MERTEALLKLRTLIGKDLVALANRSGVTVWRHGAGAGGTKLRLNKGWAGHTIERFLGLPLNSAQAPNFGSWELKMVPVVNHPRRGLRVKETMAITMIDPVEVAGKPFEESHLFNKLRRIIIVARVFEDKSEKRSLVYSVGTFDLNEPRTYAQVRADYELVRKTIRKEGFEALTGRMGKLIQPRTKGPGHGSTSRAFYARTQFVAHILRLPPRTQNRP